MTPTNDILWQVHRYVDPSTLPDLEDAPHPRSLTNNCDNNPRRIQVYLQETDYEDDVGESGKLDMREVEDGEMLTIGFILWPEGNSAIPGVPIVRDASGAQVPVMVFAYLVKDAECNIAVDHSGFPIFKAFTRNCDASGCSHNSDFFKISGSNPARWVSRVYLVNFDLISHLYGDGVRGLYIGTMKDFRATNYYGMD
ncbi:hypothetical protein NX059_012150 [Plenodomus lindquistii]|nr:hypothetical protein NX059_012150 [Plenodomus lindquistii]